jgi:hypothetical protein
MQPFAMDHRRRGTISICFRQNEGALQTTYFEAMRHLLDVVILTFLGVLLVAAMFKKSGGGQVLSSVELFAP